MARGSFRLSGTWGRSIIGLFITILPCIEERVVPKSWILTETEFFIWRIRSRLCSSYSGNLCFSLTVFCIALLVDFRMIPKNNNLIMFSFKTTFTY